MATRPPFLKEAKELPGLREKHWLDIHHLMKKKENEPYILDMIYTEATGKARLPILDRLLARYNTLRRRREWMEITRWVGRK